MGFFGSSLYSHRIRTVEPNTPPHSRLSSAYPLVEIAFSSPQSTASSIVSLPPRIHQTSLTCNLTPSPNFSPPMTALVQLEPLLDRSKSSKSVEMQHNFERRRLRYAHSSMNLKQARVVAVSEKKQGEVSRSSTLSFESSGRLQKNVNCEIVDGAEVKDETKHALLCVRPDTPDVFELAPPSPASMNGHSTLHIQGRLSVKKPRQTLLKRSILRLKGIISTKQSVVQVKPKAMSPLNPSLRRTTTKHTDVCDASTVAVDNVNEESSFAQFCEGFLNAEGGFDSLLEVV